jgi:hypothetical protein
LNKTVEKALKELPTYQWYTALPQLTSRINHANVPVRDLLKRILVRVVTDMPHQVRFPSWIDAKSLLDDAKSSLGDAKSSLGDAKSSLGDVKSSLGDAKSSLGGR